MGALGSCCLDRTVVALWRVQESALSHPVPELPLQQGLLLLQLLQDALVLVSTPGDGMGRARATWRGREGPR